MTLLARALFTLTSLLQLPNAIATFDGAFKSVDKKFIEVQVEGGEAMRMYTTRATKYIRDGHRAKASEFHDGETVTVDAERDTLLNLVAVKVELAKGKEKK